ncbi:MAG TPA: glycosyltransferase family 2 protein [Kofleriaceae bacterium]|nr:glycosyltransferase family 2 protein [Kofleriaceae bacterium]
MGSPGILGPVDDVQIARGYDNCDGGRRPPERLQPNPVYRDLRIAVVIPAYNERRKIAGTVATVPELADHIIVVDDASADDTSHEARSAALRRDRPAAVEVIRHAANRGVGGAITTGYRRALALGADIAVVMAGDGQMDPHDLPALLAPIARGQADYVKGNRFLHPAIWTTMPASRIVGNLVLSAATRVTSGYRHVFDSQCGYTAIHRRALAALALDRLFPRYGYPNDLLSQLRVANMRVVDVPVRPIYGAEWSSGIHLGTALHPIPWVLLRSWGTRVVAQVRRRMHAQVGRIADTAPDAPDAS